MYNNLIGKKLLVLGAVKMTCEIVKRAQKMGVIVYVADNRESSPAKEMADVAVFLDALDVDAIVEFCKRERIDGITTGYVDILMPACFEACKRLDLPYYATELMINAATNKKCFKEMCSKFDIKTPKSYCVDKNNYKEFSVDPENPIFVKPLDSSGSRGAKVCKNSKEFTIAFEEALKFSPTESVMVEDYLDGDEFVLDYIIVDGKPYLFSMFDKKVTSDRPSATNHANLQLCPSINLNLYIKTVDLKVKRMFCESGFNNGLIFIQGFIKNSELSFFEMGSRLGGTFADIDEYFLAVNPIDMLIHHALTGSMINNRQVLSSLNPRFSGCGAVIYLLLNKDSGIVSKIEGISDVQNNKNIVNFIQYFKEGDRFEKGTQTDIVIFAFYVVEKNMKDLKRFINSLYKSIKVYDETGRNILAPEYSVDLINADSYDND